MNAEVLDHLRALRIGARAVRTVDEGLRHPVSGGVSGLYQEIRNDGGEPIAKQVLLEEGLPQRLKGSQLKYLDMVDQRFKLR